MMPITLKYINVIFYTWLQIFWMTMRDHSRWVWLKIILKLLVWNVFAIYLSSRTYNTFLNLKKYYTEGVHMWCNAAATLISHEELLNYFKECYLYLMKQYYNFLNVHASYMKKKVNLLFIITLHFFLLCTSVYYCQWKHIFLFLSALSLSMDFFITQISYLTRTQKINFL